MGSRGAPGGRRPAAAPDRAAERALALRAGGPVAGVDEVGRGPWAGPVVAAAVILGAEAPGGLADSKRLAAPRREALAAEIGASALVGLGVATVEEIDRMNILRAAELAMTRAVAALAAPPAACLVDGNRVPAALACPAEAVVGGDASCAAIAAASIVAKVARDAMMADLARAHPGYGWERNMGYGTAEHRAALARLGLTPHHRRSFRPIHNILCEDSGANT